MVQSVPFLCADVQLAQRLKLLYKELARDRSRLLSVKQTRVRRDGHSHLAVERKDGDEDPDGALWRYEEKHALHRAFQKCQWELGTRHIAHRNRRLVRNSIPCAHDKAATKLVKRTWQQYVDLPTVDDESHLTNHAPAVAAAFCILTYWAGNEPRQSTKQSNEHVAQNWFWRLGKLPNAVACLLQPGARL